MDIKETISIIRQMEEEGVIREYAIGGAVGATLHRIEVDTTYDVDVYIVLNPPPGHMLVSLDPIHRYLDARGCPLTAEG
ncbi:MAG: hypothetical protein H7A47_00845 [Verrucomicrobiales bacterium]|nr:hypothetical protein [Verrucomicrobiales bacterium]